MIDHDGINTSGIGYIVEMTGLGVGRQDDNAARDRVELDQRQCRRQLTRGSEENRPAGHFIQAATKARRVIEIRVTKRCSLVPKELGSARIGDEVP